MALNQNMFQANSVQAIGPVAPRISQSFRFSAESLASLESLGRSLPLVVASACASATLLRRHLARRKLTRKASGRLRRRFLRRYGAMRERPQFRETIKTRTGTFNMKILRYVCLPLFLAIVAGCTITDGSSIVTGKPRDPIPLEQVRIYRVAPEHYEEIAMVSSSAGHDFKSDSALIESAIEALKKEAAKLGANGILLSSIDERDALSTSTTYGNASAHGNDGSSVYASGNSVSVDRGDTYTRMRGLAIYVSANE